MINKNITLYTYRVFTSGGHAFTCMVPFTQVEDVWVEVRRLRAEESELDTCYIAATNRVIQLGIDTKSIIAIDTAYDKPPISLKEYNDVLQAQKPINKVVKKEVREIAPAQKAKASKRRK